MSAADDGFERELADGLRRIAGGAPAGPGPGDLRRSLRRRTARRVIAAGSAGALILVALLLLRPPPQPPEPVATARTDPTVHRAPVHRPDPIPTDADSRTIGSEVGAYLSSMGARTASVEKRRGEGASFALRGPVALANEELRDGLDVLLENFDIVSLRIRDGEVRYSVVRLAQ